MAELPTFALFTPGMKPSVAVNVTSTLQQATKPLATQQSSTGATIGNRLDAWRDWIVSGSQPAETIQHPIWGEVTLPYGWNLMTGPDGRYLLPPVCQNPNISPIARGFCRERALQLGLPAEYQAQVRERERLKSQSQAFEAYSTDPNALLQFASSHLRFTKNRKMLGTPFQQDGVTYYHPVPIAGTGYSAVWRASADAILPDAYVENWINDVDYWPGAGSKLVFFGVPSDGTNFTFLPDIFAYARLGMSNLLFVDPLDDAARLVWLDKARKYLAAWILALPISSAETDVEINDTGSVDAVGYRRSREESIDLLVRTVFTPYGGWINISQGDFYPRLKWISADLGGKNFRDIQNPETPLTYLFGDTFVLPGQSYVPNSPVNIYSLEETVSAAKNFFLFLSQGDMQQAMQMIAGNYYSFWAPRFPAWARHASPGELRSVQDAGRNAMAQMVSAQAAASPGAVASTTVLAVIPAVGTVLAAIAAGLVAISGEIFKGWLGTPPVTPPELIRREIYVPAAVPGTYDGDRFTPTVVVRPDGSACVENNAGQCTGITPGSYPKKSLWPWVLGGAAVLGLAFLFKKNR